MVEMSQRQSLEAAGHCGQEEREMNAGTQFPVSFLFSPGPHLMEQCQPQVGVGESHLNQSSLKDPPQTRA